MGQRQLELDGRPRAQSGESGSLRAWLRRCLLWFDAESGNPAFLIFSGILVSFVLIVGYLIAKGTSQHLVLVLGLLPLVVMVSWLSPRAMLYPLAVWLVLVGFLRRFVPSGTKTVSGDPLLLVGFGVLLLLFITAAGHGAFRRRTVLSTAVAALTVVGVVECLNPLQGPFKVGIGGFFLVVAPMLAFWVGRAIVDRRTLRRLFGVVILLGVPAALYGLFQQLVRFPSWDLRWIQTTPGFLSLQVQGVERAFSSFASPQEYAVYLSVALVLVVALGPRMFRLVPTLAIFALLTVALVLASVRTQLGLCAVALLVMGAARVGFKSISALVALVVAGLLMIFLFSLLHPQPNSQIGANDAAGQLVNHDVAGLSQPLNSQQSTLWSHINDGVIGMKAAFSTPLGHGTGSVTQAETSVGAAGTSNGNAQAGIDFGNAGLAFGFLGLLLYAVVFLAAFTTAYRKASRERDPVVIAGLGILIVTIFQWLNGDLYSVAWLPWLYLGWVDLYRGSTPDEVHLVEGTLAAPGPLELDGPGPSR